MMKKFLFPIFATVSLVSTSIFAMEPTYNEEDRSGSFSHVPIVVIEPLKIQEAEIAKEHSTAKSHSKKRGKNNKKKSQKEAKRTTENSKTRTEAKKTKSSEDEKTNRSENPTKAKNRKHSERKKKNKSENYKKGRNSLDKADCSSECESPDPTSSQGVDNMATFSKLQTVPETEAAIETEERKSRWEVVSAQIFND